MNRGCVDKDTFRSAGSKHRILPFFSLCIHGDGWRSMVQCTLENARGVSAQLDTHPGSFFGEALDHFEVE